MKKGFNWVVYWELSSLPHWPGDSIRQLCCSQCTVVELKATAEHPNIVTHVLQGHEFLELNYMSSPFNTEICNKPSFTEAQGREESKLKASLLPSHYSWVVTQRSSTLGTLRANVPNGETYRGNSQKINSAHILRLGMPWCEANHDILRLANIDLFSRKSIVTELCLNAAFRAQNLRRISRLRVTKWNNLDL